MDILGGLKKLLGAAAQGAQAVGASPAVGGAIGKLIGNNRPQMQAAGASANQGLRNNPGLWWSMGSKPPETAQDQPQTSFLDLYNNMAPGGGLGNVQNPYQVNTDNTPTRGIPDWAAFKTGQGYSGPNMGINFNPPGAGVNLPATIPQLPSNIRFNQPGYSMPATMPELPQYFRRR